MNKRSSAIVCKLVVSVILLFLFSSFYFSRYHNYSKTSAVNKIRKFAIVYPVMHPFFESVTSGAEEAAKLSDCDIVVRAPDIGIHPVDEQIAILNKLISSRVDGIAIGTTDSKKLIPIINKAVSEGIKVICFDTDSPESNRITFIGTNNINAGVHIGEVAVKILNGKGKILCSTGVITQLNLYQRIVGMKQVFKKYPNIKILQIASSKGVPNIAIKNIEDMIKKYPDFDALIGLDSLSGPAAITVWKAMGLKKPLITFDNLPEILDGIKYGQITSSISQNQYLWGKLIIKSLNEACDGDKLPNTIYTKTTELNKSNYKELSVTISNQ